MEAVDRVQKNEALFLRQLAFYEKMSALLDEWESIQDKYKMLMGYYESRSYLDDVALADQGLFADIPCGVLSQDGIYNFLFDRKNILDEWEEKLKSSKRR